MSDSITTLETLKTRIKNFVEERDWQQFHSPKNMSMMISAEAAELMEFFIWLETKDSFAALEKHRSEVENEVADVLFGVLNFAMRCNIDLSEALEKKMQINNQRYPAEKVRGKNLKYNQY